jgi:UDP-N-acetylglucosamine 3-dehydrogenase
MDDLRVGVIGYGLMGKLHARGLESVPGTKFVAVAESNAERLAEAPVHVKTYQDYHELLETDIDAVSICLPHRWHCESTLAALAKGKHVMIEKPIAMNLTEAQTMTAAARKAGRTLFVGLTHRFYPELREAKHLIDDGAIGEVVACNDNALDNMAMLDLPPWYLDKSLAGGGAGLTDAVHLVDRLRWFTGDEVVAVAGSMGNPFFHASVDDLGQMFLQFRSGISATVTVTFMRWPHPVVCDLQVLGTEGSLTVHTWKGYDLFTPRRTVHKVVYTCEPHSEKVLVGIKGEFEEFYKSISENRTPWPSAEDSIKAMTILDAYYRAAVSKTMIRIQ